MDPNTAFLMIMIGRNVKGHAEALRGWIRSGGFKPKELLIPTDKHPFFAAHCERVHGDSQGIGIRVRADRLGIWTYSAADDDWYLAGDWKDIGALEDSHG